MAINKNKNREPAEGGRSTIDQALKNSPASRGRKSASAFGSNPDNTVQKLRSRLSTALTSAKSALRSGRSSVAKVAASESVASVTSAAKTAAKSVAKSAVKSASGAAVSRPRRTKADLSAPVSKSSSVAMASTTPSDPSLRGMETIRGRTGSGGGVSSASARSDIEAQARGSLPQTRKAGNKRKRGAITRDRKNSAA